MCDFYKDKQNDDKRRWFPPLCLAYPHPPTRTLCLWAPRSSIKKSAHGGAALHILDLFHCCPDPTRYIRYIIKTTRAPILRPSLLLGQRRRPPPIPDARPKQNRYRSRHSPAAASFIHLFCTNKNTRTHQLPPAHLGAFFALLAPLLALLDLREPALVEALQAGAEFCLLALQFLDPLCSTHTIYILYLFEWMYTHRCPPAARSGRSGTRGGP